MDIHPKNNLFLFDSFGIEGFKLQHNIKTLLTNCFIILKKCEGKSSQKLKLCTMKFCVETWQKTSQKQNTN